MFGIIYLGALLLYLLVALLLGWLAARIARNSGVAGWKAGVPVFMGIMLLVFWDWLPMEVMFQYDCSTRAGFTKYQTLDQWKAENPGVAATLQPSKNLKSIQKGNRERYVLNQRFAWDIVRTAHWFHIQEREERIVDTKTGEVLASYVDFNTDIPPIALGVKRPGAYKIWMMKRSCELDSAKQNERKFYEFKYLIKYQKEHQ